MKALLCFYFLSFICSVASADSNFQEDKALRKLDSASWSYVSSNPDSAILLSRQQKELALQKENIFYLASAYFKIGYALYYQNYFDQAAFNYYKTLDILESNSLAFKKAQNLKMYALQSLGLAYENTFNYQLAAQYYKEALAIAKESGNEKYVGLLIYNLGVVSELNGNYANAIKYYQKSTSIFEKLEDEVNLADSYNSIGNTYNKSERYGKAKENYLMALKIALNNGLASESATYISNLGENAFKQKNFSLAKEYYQQALNISDSLKDSEKIMWINSNLADVYLKEKDFEKAVNYYSKSILLASSDKINDEYQRACRNISIAYDSLGNYRLASLYKSKYMGQIELLALTKDKLHEQNAQYRMKEVEWQMERLAKNERLQFYETSVFWFRISLSLIVILLVAISFYTYKYYRKISIARRLLEF